MSLLGYCSQAAHITDHVLCTGNGHVYQLEEHCLTSWSIGNLKRALCEL